MSDLTHADLMALGQRIEDSTRREVDHVRDDMKEGFRATNDRLDKAETAVGDLALKMTEVRRDFANHVDKGETVRSLVRQNGSGKPSKSFVAGVVAAVLALGGVAEGFHQVILKWLGKSP